MWIKMDFKKFGNFNWIEMDSKDRNLDLTRTKRIYFYPFQSIFVYWETYTEAIFRYSLQILQITFCSCLTFGEQ